jgi:hypothetical protein
MTVFLDWHSLYLGTRSVVPSTRCLLPTIWSFILSATDVTAHMEHEFEQFSESQPLKNFPKLNRDTHSQ